MDLVDSWLVLGPKWWSFWIRKKAMTNDKPWIHTYIHIYIYYYYYYILVSTFWSPSPSFSWVTNGNQRFAICWCCFQHCRAHVQSQSWALSLYFLYLSIHVPYTLIYIYCIYIYILYIYILYSLQISNVFPVPWLRSPRPRYQTR